jgi:hypothetical protein
VKNGFNAISLATNVAQREQQEEAMETFMNIIFCLITKEFFFCFAHSLTHSLSFPRAKG